VASLASGLALAVLVLAPLGAPARAEEAPKVDQVYRHGVPLAGKQVPLPAGEWQVAGFNAGVVSFNARETPAVVETLVLFRLRRGMVDGFITINTNAGGVGEHTWGPARDCQRQDLYRTRVYTQAGSEIVCSFAGPVLSALDEQSAPAWRSAVRHALDQGWRVPPAWLMVGYRLADRKDVLEVRYHFNPELIDPDSSRGMLREAVFDPMALLPTVTNREWQGNPWMPVKLEQSPLRRHAVNQLIHWGEALEGPLEQGFRNALDEQLALPATPWSQAPESVDAGDPRRQGLEALHAQGRLSDAQYQEQLQAIASEPSEPQPTTKNADDPWLLVAKTAGWRVITGSSALALYLAATGNLMIAGSIVGASAVVNSGLYFAHELAWSSLIKAKNAQKPGVEFAPAGRTA